MELFNKYCSEPGDRNKISLSDDTLSVVMSYMISYDTCGLLYDGRREGEYKLHHSNGVLAEYGMYHNGKREGEFRYYKDDGQLYYLQIYRNNMLNGPYIQYGRNGYILAITQYINGLREGPYTVYDDENVIRQYYYKKDDLQFTRQDRKIYFCVIT